MKKNNVLSSAVNGDKNTIPPVGASSGQVTSDEFDNYLNLLEWVTNTQNKLPDATPKLREESFDVDPLLKGTVTPYLKNVLLQGYEINTSDNKRFELAIKDIENYIDTIDLMEAFRYDAADYLIKCGHSYRRRDNNPGTEALDKLAHLDPATMTTYEDPWDSNIIAYHQHVNVPDGWSTNPMYTITDCWFIPDGMPYIENEYEDPKALAIFNATARKYNIEDRKNLRVDNASRIIAMHKVEPGDPAPIDSVILAIWLKRLLLVNSPNLIFRVLSPFIHVVSGTMLEVNDEYGGKRLITSVPPMPSTELATTDPELYNAQSDNYNAWRSAIKRSIRDIVSCLKDGGAYASGPDMDVKVVESGRNVSYQLIEKLINLLNEEIGQAFGFPVALISANGAELATSRTILQFFNSVHAGARRDYETVANVLIKEQFENKKWTIETDDGSTDEFAFGDIDCHFKLVTPDIRDIAEEAEAGLKHAQELQTLKAVGVSKEDIQALADGAGYGMLALDNYDTSTEQPSTPIEQGPQQESMIRSAAETSPSGADETALEERLKKAYEAAKKAAADLMK